MFCLHVVLVHANANIGRIDLHQLGKRVEQSAADRNRAPQYRVVGRQFLASQRTGRVHARSRFINDHERDIVLLELLLHNVDDQLFRFPTRRAIADRHHG